jgi:hypothetical protein
MNKFIFISTALLVLFSASCKHASENEADQKTTPAVSKETADSNKYLIQAEMKVSSYSVHFAHDKEKHWPASEYKNKIMINGNRTTRSTHPFSYAELWFEGDEDNILFDSIKGCLIVHYPKNEFAHINSLFVPDTKLRISYSLADDSGQHILVSTSSQ